ncbi:MAG: adenylate/guanylate cyclase domain-containing protein [Nanoarchaeota archaeon]
MKKPNIKINFLNTFIFIILLIILFFLIYIDAFYHVRPDITDKLYGNQVPLDNILIIKIDSDGLQKIGRWPWDRKVLADLINNINEAKSIGIDISLFEISNPKSDAELQNAISKKENVVLASEVSDSLLLKPIFEVKHGYVNIITDSDGIVRFVSTKLHNKELPFTFEIYRQSWDKDIRFESKKYMINFAGKPSTFNSISFYNALSSDSGIFKDKIILIGATAPSLQDNFFVPTSEGDAMSGVEIHANIIQNIILDNFLKQQSKNNIAILVLLTSVLGMFFLSRIKIFYLIPLVILLIIIYSFLGIFLFREFNYVIDFFFVPLSLFIFTAAGSSLYYYEQKKHSVYLTDAFSKYISKDLVSQIAKHEKELKLGGSKRTISIFFSDIRGFTSFSEKLSPEKLTKLLNSYLTEMTSIIMKNNGTVDKFIGDAIMAFWNAPLLEKNHAYLACISALQQIIKLKEMQRKWKKQNLPEINIGCGINTGEAIIGNLGSKERFNYTAIGDSVNLASRLEGLTKFYGVSILVSEKTYELVKDKFKFRKLDVVKVKGKTKPIIIYELTINTNEKFIKLYEEAFSLYTKKKFKLAINKFKDALKLNNLDLSTKIMIKRCNSYIKTPLKSWGGVFEMKSK